VDFIEENQPKGQNKIVWAPGDLPDGIYYFRLQTDKQNQSGEIVYINP